MAAAKPRGVLNKVHITEAQAHKLPRGTMWVVTVLVAMIMATCNFCQIWLVRFFVEWKFESMQNAADTGGPFYGLFMLTGIDALMATICTILVFVASPIAGSSGAPENKGWLNGSPMDSFFTFRNLVVRAMAMLLANASSFPVGREGPSVTMGSNIAFLVTRIIAMPHVRQWVDVGPKGEGCMPVSMVDEERLRHAQRVAGCVGGACAMAMIFDAPIGGVLYMFEEVTVYSWHLELTFRAFTGTLICTILSYYLLDLCGTSLKAFVLYEWNPSQELWDWQDVPIFFIISGILGPFSALHTYLALEVGAIRQKVHSALSKYQPYARMIETVLYASTCAVVCGLFSLLAKCDDNFREETMEALSYVRYNCPEGSYNPVASLLLTTSEGAVRRLFSLKNTGDLYPSNSFLAFFGYTALNICLTGIPVPSGNFTGTMLIGGLVGRCVGAVARRAWRNDLAPTGVYAMVGSAAMLCGFKKISMAVVVFIVEAGNDLNLTTPLMMSVVIALTLNTFLMKSGFDEEQIVRKDIPFLPPKPPHNIHKCVAADLMDLLAPQAVLTPEAPLAVVQAALDQPDVVEFPVVDKEGVCVGFVPRSRLEAAYRVASSFGPDTPSEPTSPMSPMSPVIVSTRIRRRDRGMPVSRIATPLHFMIPEEAPAKLFYSIFAKTGASCACVVSKTGKFRGLISRGSLIHATRTLRDEDSSDGSVEEEEELLALHGGLQVPLRWFVESREWDDD